MKEETGATINVIVWRQIHSIATTKLDYVHVKPAGLVFFVKMISMNAKAMYVETTVGVRIFQELMIVSS